MSTISAISSSGFSLELQNHISKNPFLMSTSELAFLKLNFGSFLQNWVYLQPSHLSWCQLHPSSASGQKPWSRSWLFFFFHLIYHKVTFALTSKYILNLTMSHYHSSHLVQATISPHLDFCNRHLIPNLLAHAFAFCSIALTWQLGWSF